MGFRGQDAPRMGFDAPRMAFRGQDASRMGFRDQDSEL